MRTYVLLTTVSPESAGSPAKLKKLEAAVKNKIAKHCPQVKWRASYAILGPCDYLDIFEAADDTMAGKVATIVRSFGHASTETWSAIPWPEFKRTLDQIS